MGTLQGEVEFWHILAFILSALVALIVLAPPLAELVARWTYAHAVAVGWLYRGLARAWRNYRRVYGRVMRETAQ